IGQDSSPFPRERHARSEFVRQISHVALILGTVSCPQLPHIRKINAIGKIYLPLRVYIELRLRPTAVEQHSMLSDRADGETRLPRIDAEDAERPAFKRFT